MSRRIAKLALLLGSVALLASGCRSVITGPGGGGVQPGVNGDAWYVRNTYYFVFLASSEIYWCDGDGVCKRARIED